MKLSPIEVKLIDHMGTDLSVVNAARVSFHKESEWDMIDNMEDGSRVITYTPTLKKGDVGLINYLAKHKHFSPFNHAFLSFRIKAPIFVARQLVKHKFMPWNEVSRRYVDEEPEFFMPEVFRAKAENVKQGSGEDMVGINEQVTDQVAMRIQDALMTYDWMLSTGVCAEQARMVLPQNMMTEWIWSGTLGAYADMLKLRLDPHTQYESRIVAQKIYEVVKGLFPVSINALLENK